MRTVLLDTNVIIGAADLSNDKNMPDTCKRNCLQRVKQWRAGVLRLILDSEKKILSEYIQQFRAMRSQRGFQGSPSEALLNEFIRVLTAGEGFKDYPTVFVVLTELGEHEYAEYPEDTELASFDRSDRKWVASARSYQMMYPDEDSPEIQNATDSDWDSIEEFLLKKYKIIVSNICG